MKFGATPLDVTAAPAPMLGQHTREILGGSGLSQAEMEELERSEIIFSAPKDRGGAPRGMKAIVCVKQVPDTSGKVAVNPDGTLNRASMQAITNPDDNERHQQLL